MFNHFKCSPFSELVGKTLDWIRYMAVSKTDLSLKAIQETYFRRLIYWERSYLVDTRFTAAHLVEFLSEKEIPMPVSCWDNIDIEAYNRYTTIGSVTRCG